MRDVTSVAIFDDEHLDISKTKEEKAIFKKKQKIEKKRLKKLKKLPKVFMDITPLRYVKNENCFVLANGVTDYVQINGVRIDDLHHEDKQQAINQFHAFLKQYDPSFKLIYQTFPADTSEQLHFLNHKIYKNTNPTFQPFLEHKRWELEQVGKKILHQEFYFQIFAKDEEDLEVLRRRVLNIQYPYFHMNPITFEKKMKILFKLNNMNTDILPYVPRIKFYFDTPPLSGYDPEFLHYIQPRGNMTPHSRYIEKGDGFETCIHLYEYKRDSRPFWGRGLFNKKNVVTIQDSMTVSQDKILLALDDSAAEQENRYDTATKHSTRKVAKKEYHALDALADEVVDTQETVKELHTRIFVYAKTKSDLEDQVVEILGDLTANGYRGIIQLNEMEEDYRALFTNYETQYKAIPRRGQDIKSESLAASYAFDFSYHMDSRATYCGNTFSGGAVAFDHLHKDKKRLSYNMLVCGIMGSGKSTTLKKIATSRVILGDQVFIFAVSKEFNRMAEALGGVSYDVSDRAVNMLEVFATCVDEDTLETKEETSFSVHLSKVQLIYRFLSQEHKPELEKLLLIQLGEFYEHWCQLQGMEMDKITSYTSQQYPILEDFYHFLLQALYEDVEGKKRHPHLSGKAADLLEDLIFNVYSIIKIHPMFNKKTESLNITDIPIVIFNIETMLKMEKGALNAQLFNLLSGVGEIMIKAGQLEKARHDNGETGFYDYVYRLLIIDEFHNLTRSGYIEQLNMLDRFFRELRKYFGSSILASHNFSDMLPKANGSKQSDVDGVMNEIFSLATYKAFMKQNVDSVDLIREWYGREFSESELMRIPHFDEGQTLMNIAGVKNIGFKWDLSRQEDRLFSGGL